MNKIVLLCALATGTLIADTKVQHSRPTEGTGVPNQVVDGNFGKMYDEDTGDEANPFEFRVDKLIETIQEWHGKLPNDRALGSLLEALDCKSIKALTGLDKKDQQKRVRELIDYIITSDGKVDEVEYLIRFFFEKTTEPGRFNPLAFYRSRPGIIQYTHSKVIYDEEPAAKRREAQQKKQERAKRKKEREKMDVNPYVGDLFKEQKPKAQAKEESDMGLKDMFDQNEAAVQSNKEQQLKVQTQEEPDSGANDTSDQHEVTSRPNEDQQPDAQPQEEPDRGASYTSEPEVTSRPDIAEEGQPMEASRAIDRVDEQSSTPVDSNAPDEAMTLNRSLDDEISHLEEDFKRKLDVIRVQIRDLDKDAEVGRAVRQVVKEGEKVKDSAPKAVRD